MRKTNFKHANRLIAIIALLLISAGTLSACTGYKIKQYPDTPSAYAVTPVYNIPVLTAESDFYPNPDRGFRGETYITLGTDEAFPESGETYTERLEAQLEKYSSEGVTVLQCYVYLYEYRHTPIPDEALEQLKNYFSTLRDKNVKILLRFAYEYTSANKDGPRTSDIITHCAQLKTFFEQNIGLYRSVVYAMQLGMIGLWGEGHGNVNALNKARIIKAVADMTPEPTVIMVRTPELLSLVPDELEHRFSIHDDFIVGFDHEWGMISFEDPAYPLLLSKCKHTVTDGEMPWGRGNVEGTTAQGVIAQCVGYGLSTLSLEHNYTEDGCEYYLKQWQALFLDGDFFTGNGYPLNPNLLSDGKISVFDYLKHHLGYQLTVSDFEAGNGKASFMITNYGMAAPHGYKMKIYVDGAEVAPDNAFDGGSLLMFGQSVITFGYDGGRIGIELYKENSPSDKIKLYNDVPFENGVNVIVG